MPKYLPFIAVFLPVFTSSCSFWLFIALSCYFCNFFWFFSSSRVFCCCSLPFLMFSAFFFFFFSCCFCHFLLFLADSCCFLPFLEVSCCWLPSLGVSCSFFFIVSCRFLPFLLPFFAFSYRFVSFLAVSYYYFLKKIWPVWAISFHPMVFPDRALLWYIYGIWRCLMTCNDLEWHLI